MKAQGMKCKDRLVDDETMATWRSHVVRTAMEDRETKASLKTEGDTTTNEEAAMLAEALRTAKRHLRHLVVSEIDKARGELFIC